MVTTLDSERALSGFRCRSCGLLQPADERYVCGTCLGPIEPEYDLARLRRDGNLRSRIQAGPASLWRYSALLPTTEAPGAWPSGWTPLVSVPRLGAAIGIADLWIKDDTRNITLSFKDRPVAVAAARAQELGLTTLACASTGNLAGAVAAAAARLGMRAFVFVPADTEPSKVAAAASYGATVVRVNGTYDRVNRLCATLADDLPWGFVNFTLRPYYAEGSKTMLFEIAEQNGWRLPDHVVVPVGSGALLTRTATAVAQLVASGLVPETPMRISAAQPAGCAPVSDAILDGWRAVQPTRDVQTIAKSLAIGSPADGDGSVAVVRRTNGSAGSVSDAEIVAACALAATTEGLSVEPAGGTTIAAAYSIARAGRIRDGERVVLYLTGNGYKQGAHEATELGPVIAPDTEAFLHAYPEAT